MITKEQRAEIDRVLDGLIAQLRELKRRYGTPAQAFEESYRGTPRPTRAPNATAAFREALRREG